MGQKIHPIGLRLNITRPWSSRWFATKDYAKNLTEDRKIRLFIKKKLFSAGVSSIDIERKSNQLEVNITAAKPGIIVGRGGQGIDQLRRDLSTMTGKKVQVNILEISKIDADAQLVAESVAAQLEKRIAFRRAMKQAMMRAMKSGAKGIKIGGMRNMMFRFASCCQPVPGEGVVGFVTRGRGVSIHRSDCPNALQMLTEDERRVEVKWDVGGDQSFLVKLEVLVEDRKNMLRDITQAISDTDTNVRGAEIKGGETTASGSFIVEVKNINHLNKTIKKIKKVKGVIQVERSRGLEGIEETQKDEIK